MIVFHLPNTAQSIVELLAAKQSASIHATCRFTAVNLFRKHTCIVIFNLFTFSLLTYNVNHIPLQKLH
jgi:hypothetical protein